MEMAKEERSLAEPEDSIIKISLALLEEKEKTEVSEVKCIERRIIKAKVIEDIGFAPSSSLLNKKVKRPNAPLSWMKSSAKDSLTACLKIFNQFKSTINYKEYPLFIQIRKNVKNNVYANHTELCTDIRDTFTHYFSQCAFEPEKYCQLLTACSLFETQYKDYGDKIFIRDSRTLIDIKKKLNSLKRELRESNIHWALNGSDGHHVQASSGGNGCLNSNSYDRLASKKYKVQLANEIRHLNPEQKKGIASILSKDCVDLSDSTIEIDVNKIPNCQLKELEKYVLKCLKSNSISSVVNNGNTQQEKGNINNSFLLQKADSTMNSLNQEIQSEKERGDCPRNRQALFSDSDSILSDDSDSDVE